MLGIADDLSGAVEAAAALAPAGGSVVLLGRHGSVLDPPSAPVVVLDVDARSLGRDDARAAFACGLDALDAVAADSGPIFVKIDSLLRGPIAAVLEVLHDRQRPAVLAPAVPAFGRSVRAGQVLLDGVPLHETDTWAAERRMPPTSIASAAAPVPITLFDAQDLDAADLPARIAHAVASGTVAVCDAATDAELDHIAGAALQIPHAALVGAVGLAAATGRALGPRSAAPPPSTGRPTAPDGVLVVVGTAAPQAHADVAALVAGGARHICVGSDRRPEADSTSAEVTVLSLAPPAARERRACEMLAAWAANLLANSPRAALVVTGGETARRTLDALDVRSLRPYSVLHAGAVASRTDSDDRTVVTRPGSVGGANSLDRIVRHLLSPTTTEGRW